MKSDSQYRINGFEQIKSFYSWVFNNQDKRITPQHISLYNFLINQNNRNNWVEWFKCPFDLGMAGSCIGNKKTYYKCLDDLMLWKLIHYQKGTNNWKAPLIKIEVLNCTTSETASVPSSEPQPIPLDTPLPTHIYKLITNNLKSITDHFIAFEKYVLSLDKKKNTFDFSFCDSSYLEIFQIWLNYKRERKETYKTQDSLQACYNNLLKLSNNKPEIAREIVNWNMAQNYAGLFPLKNTKPDFKEIKLKRPEDKVYTINSEIK